MDIRDRWDIREVFDSIASLRLLVGRLSRSLKRNVDSLSGRFAELDAALDRLNIAAGEVETITDRLIDDEDWSYEPSSFNKDETKRLQHLSRVMNDISQFMHETADTIRPVMQAKKADDTDPMFDYEIEAKLDYELREDDPEYDEDIDNYLSSRKEHLHRERDENDLNEDWRCSLTPEPFQSEPLSWQLHSLTEHTYGADAPRVRVKNCLRIGRVYLDIQVWWQYAFDVEAGKWIKRWRRPEGTPEYAQKRLSQEMPATDGENDASKSNA